MLLYYHYIFTVFVCNPGHSSLFVTTPPGCVLVLLQSADPVCLSLLLWKAQFLVTSYLHCHQNSVTLLHTCAHLTVLCTLLWKSLQCVWDLIIITGIYHWAHAPAGSIPSLTATSLTLCCKGWGYGVVWLLR